MQIDSLFYQAFSDRFRGSRDLIYSRLLIYLPFINPFKKMINFPSALDLGCGRGEFLELLGKNGFDAKGVDLNNETLKTCQALNLNVASFDILTYLKNAPDNSLCIISAFHVVEHIPFNILQDVVKEAYRALIPGGLLILETPNPENLIVGMSNFYLDPTHHKPLPALLLGFLAEYTGFCRVKTLYLQETSFEDEQISLLNVFHHVSPDYAIVAQKNASQEILLLFNEPFERTYGVNLNTLIEKYENRINSELNKIKIDKDNMTLFVNSLTNDQFGNTGINKHKLCEFKLSSLQKEIDHLKDMLNMAEDKMHGFNQSANHWWKAAGELQNKLDEIYAGKFWRISHFFFNIGKNIYWWVYHPIKTTVHRVIYSTKRIFKKLLFTLARKVNASPVQKKMVLIFLNRMPKLKNYLSHYVLFPVMQPSTHHKNNQQKKIQVNRVYPSAHQYFVEVIKKKSFVNRIVR